MFVFAFPGMGKTTLAKTYSEVVDLELSDIKYDNQSVSHLTKEERKSTKRPIKDKYYKKNYTDKAFALQEEGKIVLVALNFFLRLWLLMLASGRVKCWGDNQWGQLGIGRKSPPKRLIRGWGGGIVGWPFPVPVRVPGIRTATAVSSGLEHACALLRGGTVSCWGVNEDDRLGRRTYLPAWVKPMLVPDVTTATSVSAGKDYTCAVMSDGSVKCWGQNEFWEAGRASEPDADRDVTSPVEVPGVVGVARIVANNDGGRDRPDAGCGVTQNGGLLCWGGYEQEPLTVVNGPGVSAVASGSRHTCIVEMGAVKCWGSNSYGQLGVKGRYGKYFPTPVLVRGL